MPRRKPDPPEVPLRRITFEAALNPNGQCYSVNNDGEARLTLVVPESTAKPLAEAMASGWLRNSTFLVTLAKPDTAAGG